ncbi:primase C-terminal domain-containing protein [Streptococcus danieliae]|uniref:Primase C-terminal domain-containing protein n=1 Tax=Streptococcus danieliae TaxID=747656 RepID=A0A7Z0LDJ5_9STRE|nr:primase alpha helix C-terminal domain-containing protein [Streptococcus danieliae]MBF0717489.1 primase alpha helix C-terminal domain-containing protein [Streptococcus danieliae]NYS49419.1 primase C-terminal domain-containing protein [Streptococcus danieliae]
MIYTSIGVQNRRLTPVAPDMSSWDYLATLEPVPVPPTAGLGQWKKSQAPYCIAGTVEAEPGGSYKRSNKTLVARDLIFLDYDELENQDDFFEAVSEVLSDYTFLIYPTISYSLEKPKYRLVVKPDSKMDEASYKATVREIGDRIGLPYDGASLTWSQLQGLPVETQAMAGAIRFQNLGQDYPVQKVEKTDSVGGSSPRSSGGISTAYSGDSLTMRVVKTLLNGLGDEGGRNVALTRFVGLLYSKYVRCDVATAYELAKIANSVTTDPLPIEEVDRTFESITEREIEKRRLGL